MDGMKNKDGQGELYRSDVYCGLFPSLFAEDAGWKWSKVRPLIDRWVSLCGAKEKESVHVLDVGAGAGLMLKAVGDYLCEEHHLVVRKSAVEVSPGMMEALRKNHPDLELGIEKGLMESSLPDKSVDLLLLIDVLEHLDGPGAALEEMGRISRYVILKVPLESHLFTWVSNFFNWGQTIKQMREKLGHVNCYCPWSLKKQIRKHLGEIVEFRFANAYAYELESKKDEKGLHRCVRRVCAFLHGFWPGLAARVFTDFALVLVKSR